jgi:hypothetical protein
MFISCATAAPSRHPPAHSPPAASSLVTARRWPARATAGRQMGRLWEGSPTPMTEGPLNPFQSSREIGVGDTSRKIASHHVSVRGPRSTRRGQGSAARDNRQVRPANARVACRLPAAFTTTPQLQPTQRVWTPVAKNASSDTRRHATCDTRHAICDMRQRAMPGDVVREDWTGSQDVADRQGSKEP